MVMMFVCACAVVQTVHKKGIRKVFSLNFAKIKRPESVAGGSTAGGEGERPAGIMFQCKPSLSFHGVLCMNVVDLLIPNREVSEVRE